jgi:hypothetical protein
MLRGVIRLIRGLLGLPIAIRLWLVILVGLNMIVPLFFLDRPEARITVVTMIVAASLMVILTRAFGFTRVLGAAHVVWLGLIPYLWMRLAGVPAQGLYGYWLRAVMVANTISLVFDIADVVRYARGDRAPIVDGL